MKINRKHYLYATLAKMRYRCNNPNFPDYKFYGARGISVCDEWTISFKAFVLDMGDRPDKYTLDRIDNDGNYEPSNCRWASRLTQSQNTRITVSEEKVKLIKSLLLEGFNHREIAKEIGVRYHVVGEIARGNTWKNI